MAENKMSWRTPDQAPPCSYIDIPCEDCNWWNKASCVETEEVE